MRAGIEYVSFSFLQLSFKIFFLVYRQTDRMGEFNMQSAAFANVPAEEGTDAKLKRNLVCLV